MIRRLTRVLSGLPSRILTAASGFLEDGIARVEAGASDGKWRWTSRLWAFARRTWRIWAKALMIAMGVGVFLGLEYGLAVAINHEQWYLIGAVFIGTICLAAIYAKPSIAFIAWLTLSPVAGIYLRLGKVGDLPQITFDRVMIYSLVMVLLLRCLAAKQRPRKLILPEYLLLAFPVFIILTIPFFPHDSPQRTALQFMTRIGDPVMVYFIAKAAILDKRHIGAVVAGLFAVGVYSTAMAMYDHFTGRMSLAAISGIEADLYYSDAGGRAAGPFLSPLDLGAMLSITIPLALHYAEWTKRNAARYLYWLCVPTMAAAWFFTYTRGAYIPLVVVMLLMPVLAVKCRRRYLAALTALAILGMVGLPIYIARPDVAKRLTQRKTAEGRIVLAKTLANLIRANPWFGVGLHNYREEMPKYIADDLLARWIWHGGSSRSLPELTSSHNTYLTLAAEHGLVGLALYLGSFVGFGAYLLRLRKRFPAEEFLGRDLVSLVVLVMAGFFLAINTTNMEGRSYVNCVIWILVAAVIRLAQIVDDETKCVGGERADVQGGFAYGR